MALASTDLLIVQRAEESYKVPASEIKSFILGSAGGGVLEQQRLQSNSWRVARDFANSGLPRACCMHDS